MLSKSHIFIKEQLSWKFTFSDIKHGNKHERQAVGRAVNSQSYWMYNEGLPSLLSGGRSGIGPWMGKDYCGFHPRLINAPTTFVLCKTDFSTWQTNAGNPSMGNKHNLLFKYCFLLFIVLVAWQMAVYLNTHQ